METAAQATAERAMRFKRSREKLEKKQNEMAQLVGVSKRSWQDYESGQAEAKVSVYERLGELGFNPGWLINGTEPEMLTERRVVDESGNITPAVKPPAGHIALPLYSVDVAAGPGVIVQAERAIDWIYFKKGWLRRELGVDPKELGIVKAVGRSMEPDIHDGDLLIVDLKQPTFRGDGIYVIALVGEMDSLSVKLLSRNPVTGSIYISSRNREVFPREYEVPPEELPGLRIVGRVVWIGGKA